MDAFEQDHQVEPQDGGERGAGPAELAGGGPAQDRAHVLGRIEGVPGRAIGLLPFRVGHLGMMRDAVIEVVLVHVGVHPDPFLPQHLVVLRAGQRREEEELEDVERQFALDDLDVANDRFLGVAGEAEDIAGVGDGAVVAPLLQHLAVFGDLVLALLGGDQVVGIDVLEPDEDAADAGLRRLLDEVRNLVAERVDLDGEAELGKFAVAQLDQPVEQDLPVAVAGEIVVGDEEPLDALRVSSRARCVRDRRASGSGSCGPAR